ncbi:MAG: DUF4248 domain-containing protein [Bacteroides sp.]|nr:DUF4248 domain-containing protein [Bacteroides sp.]
MKKNVITFAELAMLYFPYASTPRNAVRSLNRWINRCPEMLQELRKTGYGPYNHRYLTPRQHAIIVKYLDPPE